MEASASQIGGRIKRLRRVRHLNQADLAAALGISPSYLNLIEHNRRKASWSTAMKVGWSVISWRFSATISLPTVTSPISRSVT
jgi:DNA-binding XRE family transcriptional regulator